uniref:Ig-like domain-containing protein n=1 Tax=Pygocentrus nattereri TaxID=42514 RepID=A0A3B4E9J8_PYGNA
MFIKRFSLSPVKSSDITDLQVQTVRRGDNTTIKCHQKAAKDDLLFWYQQSLGKLPQYIVRPFVTMYRFKNSRFTVDNKTFDLSINGVKEEDIGIYFCANLKSGALEFLSGTLLLFAGNSLKMQISHKYLKVILKRFSKGSVSGHQDNSKHEDTDALNYATVKFAKKPPSRAPRVTESQDIYSQVKVR